MSSSFDKVIHKIANVSGPISLEALNPLLKLSKSVTVTKKDLLLKDGMPAELEYFVISGILRSFIVDQHGDDTTSTFHLGPCIFTPSIARSLNGQSLVSCEALEDCQLQAFRSEDLIKLMMKDPQIQAWGDSVLRAELVRRATREHMLAAQSGKTKLDNFRKQFPDLEKRVPHSNIASYLGMTSVSLSRLRHQ